MRRRATALALAGVALAAAHAPPAHASACSTVPAYPGDDAPSPLLAAWMATGATAAGLPGELPVMGALVESGLRNLSAGDADARGFFQMRTSIWDQGGYAGFPGNPPLQLQWFTDQAAAIGTLRLARGLDNADPLAWGAWVADVLRPPEQLRGRYQLRLAEASALIAAGCPAAPPPLVPDPPADTAAPGVVFLGPARVRAIRRRAVALRLACTGEPCEAAATGVLVISGRARRPRLTAAAASLAAGEGGALRLRIPVAGRRALRRASRDGRTARARLTLTVRDAGGNAAVYRRTLRLE